MPRMAGLRINRTLYLTPQKRSDTPEANAGAGFSGIIVGTFTTNGISREGKPAS